MEVVRIGRVAGEFNGMATISSFALSVGQNSMLNVIKDGNNKGSALLEVLSNIFSTSDNRIGVGNRGVCGGPSIGNRYFFVPSFPCFSGDTALRGATCLCHDLCPG